MNPHLQQLAHLSRAVEFEVRAHPRVVGGVAAGVVAAGVVTWFLVNLKRPTASELEGRRRDYLVNLGRITDGVILDARTLTGEDSTSSTPEVLLYSYRVAGVTYNCAQDVSLFPELVLGFRLDQSIQVRYDPRNPGNSILIADDWTGLWQRSGEEGRTQPDQ